MKNYQNWHEVKTHINNSGKRPIKFRVRQIWWCSIGKNIGSEEDGKGPNFVRPVLIVRKFSKTLFLGIPLTSKPKPEQNPHYYQIECNHKNNWLILSQSRSLDSLRLIRKLDEIKQPKFEEVKRALSAYLKLS